jgi:hypothetical protein
MEWFRLVSPGFTDCQRDLIRRIRSCVTKSRVFYFCQRRDLQDAVLKQTLGRLSRGLRLG